MGSRKSGCTAWALLTILAVGVAGAASAQEQLVVLTETGRERDGLPVFERHPDPVETVEGLTRGLSGTMVRVHAMTQAYRYTHEGVEPEPVYLLLSSRRGGFARVGFFLGAREKRDVGYVDVHGDWPISGRFGAVDQIFPHELAHLLRRQLVGELTERYANQVHALGVRTDRSTAFDEGFAESVQAVAFDRSPDVPYLAGLARDRSPYERSLQRLAAYREEVAARFAYAPPMRMGFLLWYTNDEDLLRYFAVRDNAFAREPFLPEGLLNGSDPYGAYLLENVMPGAPSAPAKPVARMLASEAVVAALFYRWAIDDRIGSYRRQTGFYAPFGVTPESITDLENTYLKLVDLLWRDKPRSVLEVIVAYRARFPEEGAWVDEIAGEIFMDRRLVDVEQIWLANREFSIGTTVYDQYRGLPRPHTFDLNAASVVDLVGVEGIDRETARAVVQHAPYGSVAEVRAVPGVSAEVAERLASMAAEMELLLAERQAEADPEEVLSVGQLVMPFVWRLAWLIAVCATTGALVHRHVVGRLGGPVRGWARSVADGLAAAVVGTVGGWALGWSGLGAIVAVALLLGVPGAALHRWLRRPDSAAAVLAGWLLAALPAALLTTAWF